MQSPRYQTPVITAVYVGAGVVIGVILVFSLFPWAYVLGAVGVVAAVVLCRRGLRGRVLRLPACPACGYDMRHRTGLTCPECGHTVEHAQNLRRRERRPRLIAAGLACLLLLTPAGMQLRGVDAWSMAPAWVLLTACEMGNVDAQWEITQRSERTGLADFSQAQRERFIAWSVLKASKPDASRPEIGRALLLLLRQSDITDARLVPLLHRLSVDESVWFTNTRAANAVRERLDADPPDPARCDAAARLCLDPAIHHQTRHALVDWLTVSGCNRWDAVEEWLDRANASEHDYLRELFRQRRESTGPPP